MLKCLLLNTTDFLSSKLDLALLTFNTLSAKAVMLIKLRMGVKRVCSLNTKNWAMLEDFYLDEFLEEIRKRYNDES